MRKNNWLIKTGNSLVKKVAFLLLLFLVVSPKQVLCQSPKDGMPRITLDAKNEPMSSVLKKIEQASHYKIIFTYDEIQNYKVTISIKNKPVNEAIRAIIGNYPLAYKIKNIFVTIYAVKPGEAQKKISGIVTDKDGEPLIGVNIITDKPGIVGISNIDGEFDINVPDGKKVETVFFSFVGQKKISVPFTGNPLYVTMADDTQLLDEMVVVGYGVQKKSSLTSSIETIKGEDLLKMPGINLDQALTGQVAGLQARSVTGDPSSGREAEIRIRGIQGSPLLVIDGVPRSGVNNSGEETRLSDLNPDDVESISILKDAAASAVYGARAANGVILVKTKRSKGDRTRVDYRGQFSIQQATELPKFINSYEFAKLYNQAVAGSGVDTYKPYTSEQLETIRTQSNPNLYGNENMLDYLKSTGFSTIHNISVSGGSNALRYYTSLGYAKTRGLYSGVGRDRYNYAIKLDANLTKGLTLSVDITGTRSENTNSGYATIDAAYNFSPLQTLRFTDGSLASINGSNPLLAIEGTGGYISNKTNMNNMSVNLNYEIPSIKGLSLYLKASYDNNNFIVKTFNKPTPLYLYTDLTKEITVDPQSIYPKAKISLEEKNSSFDSKLLEAGVNYSRVFGKHNIAALLVTNYQDNKSRFLDGTNNNLPGIYPEIIGVSLDSKLSGSESIKNRASIIGRINYSFDNRYFIESSFRQDGSTKFVKKNRWELFSTVSGSWVASNEPFFKTINQSILSILKFRGSLGVLGNDGDIQDYTYLWNYIYLPTKGYNIGDAYNTSLVMNPSSYPNPNLRMEKSTDYNLGLDLGFWNNRITISMETYWRYRINALTPAASYLFPPSAGTDGNVPYVNSGKVKAWGWDMTISHKNAINKFKYDFTVTLSRINDKVLDNGDESTILESQRRVGKSNMCWLVYEADGLFKTLEDIVNYGVDQDGKGNASLAPGDIRYKDQNDDHVITEADRIYVKNSSIPDLAYSFNLGLKYNGFFFNALFQGVNGSNQKINELYTLESGTLPRFQEYHLSESFSDTNPNGTYPRVKFASKTDNNRKESTFWIKNCNYLRLKSMSLGYAFSSNLVKKMHLSSLSVSLQASNLFTWSSLKDMDPESLRGYPIQRTGGLSLNLGF